MKKILSLHGISEGKKRFKISNSQALEVIRLFNSGKSITNLARQFEVDKCTIRSLLKRYNVNYLTV